MKRLVVSILATITLTVSLVALLVAPAGAARVPPPIFDDCQTRTSSSSTSRPDNMIWMPDIAGGIHRWGHYRVSNCRTSVSWVPRGHAFDGQADLEARLRIFNVRTGNTARVTEWVFANGGGPAVRLAGMLTNNEEFSVEYRNVMALYRQEPYHPLGTIRF